VYEARVVNNTDVHRVLVGKLERRIPRWRCRNNWETSKTVCLKKACVCGQDSSVRQQISMNTPSTFVKLSNWQLFG
jgi:hypothetical protein